MPLDELYKACSLSRVEDARRHIAEHPEWVNEGNYVSGTGERGRKDCTHGLICDWI